MLHAGGKFGGEGYKISGGLHGVGVSVVNALSTPARRSRSTATAAGGSRTSPTAASPGRPARAASATRSSGTTVTFWPDGTIFEETEFRAQTLLERLREMAFLNKGLEIRFRDERPDDPARADLQVRRRHRRLRQAPQRSRRSRCSSGSSRSRSSGEDYEVEVAMQWNTGYYEGIHSFANNIATTEGGMHEEGFKKALTNVVNRYATARASSRRRTTTSSARTSARASPRSSR